MHTRIATPLLAARNGHARCTRARKSPLSDTCCHLLHAIKADELVASHAHSPRPTTISHARLISPQTPNTRAKYSRLMAMISGTACSVRHTFVSRALTLSVDAAAQLPARPAEHRTAEGFASGLEVPWPSEHVPEARAGSGSARMTGPGAKDTPNGKACEGS